ncbi:MAG: hypothetical protein GY795_44680, partial [Desulfobacterales bacterium]|nr:hypothetical protein [Desulfobacterales bacterium]
NGITVSLYSDTDGDGIAEPDTDDGSALSAAATAGDAKGSPGYYSFTGLAPGSYFVVFTAPDGYIVTMQNIGADDATDSDADSVTGRTAVTELVGGEHDPTWDAGLYQLHTTASLGDYVWYDADQDGIQGAGELGISGVTVKLINPATGQVIQTLTTDGSGYYRFANLLPGEYAVEFELPTGYIFISQHQGADSATDSNADTITGITPALTITAGENNLTIDAGMFNPNNPPASLGDYVWHDQNENGVQDTGEPGIADVKVILRDAATDKMVASITTDIDGYYEFTGLLPDDYIIEFELPPGYIFTDQEQGTDNNRDSNADTGTGRTEPITLSAGESNLSIDGGMIISTVLANLGDFVWYDTDQDGVQETGEPGISGVTVKLINLGTGTVRTTKTNGSGYYEFTGLLPGDYTVEFDLPSEHSFTNQNQGTDNADSDADASTGRTEIITLSAGANNMTTDAGMFSPYEPASINSNVWHDADNNGVQDIGEQGVGNMTVILRDAATDEIIAESVSDSSGYYEFTGLLPGDYVVEFDLPEGTGFTPQSQGTDNTSDSDANSITGRTETISVSPGENNLTADAGIVAVTISSLGNFVWYDDDQDGIQDTSETGINGVSVSLYRDADGDYLAEPGKDDGNALITTITADDIKGNPGYYNFTNLVPDKYFVVFTLPADHIVTKQDQGSDDTADSDADHVTSQTVVTELVGGEHDPTWDAGLYASVETTSLGNYVWYDSNEDGIQDASETGINGITVSLYSDADGDGIAEPDTDDGALLSTADTSVNSSGNSGYYSFTGLVPGSYFVIFTVPAGYIVTIQDIGADDTIDSDADPVTGQTVVTELIDGEHDPTWDAGLYASDETASLGNYVWYDVNHNGIQEIGEPGIPNVRVNLLNSATGEVIWTITNGSGYYEFTNLSPENYIVEFELPTDYIFTVQNQGQDYSTDSNPNIATGRTEIIALSAGENNLTIDAGMFSPYASLGNYVWHDTNENGLQDSEEPGIPSVTVSLWDSVTGQSVASTMTDNNGYYEFTGLNPGDYVVEFELPSGYNFTDPHQGTDDDADSDPDPTTGRTPPVTLSAGENNTATDAGMFTPELTSLGDYVWYDANYNGIQDADEPGVPEVKVNLYDYTGTILLDTITNEEGLYVFTDLEPGDYLVEFILPDGYAFTRMNQGDNDALDSDAGTDGRTHIITLGSGEHFRETDAGLYTPITLGDLVWMETDNNGIPSPGEGLPDIRIVLYDGNDNLIAETFTNENGNYLFTNLPPGDYSIEVDTTTLPDRAEQFFDPDGVLDSGIDLPDQQTDYFDADFGYRLNTASLGDYVWYDADQNGVQDYGEPGITGVLVNLYDSTGDIIAVTETGASGFYKFTGLKPGDYIVEFILPERGYMFSPKDSGTGVLQDIFDSDADTETGRTGIITLSFGEENLTADAGMVVPGMPSAGIGNFVWYDANQNGNQEPDETGVAGVNVLLINPETGAVIAATTTDGSGFYAFEGLVPGNYVVEFQSSDSDYTLTPQYQGNDETSDSNADPATGQTDLITLSSGEHNLTVDAGMISGTIPGGLGYFIWYDINSNGIQEPDEPGLSDVKVNLYDSTGTSLIATAFTGSGGHYEFTGLPPGDYIVEFILPRGYDFTLQNQGENPEIDSDADADTGFSHVVHVNAGESARYLDAGLYTENPIMIGDLVWLDLNNDGLPGEGEGIEGVSVILYNGDGIKIAATVTNENGNYLFSNLPQGDYRVEIDTSALPLNVILLADPDDVLDSVTDLPDQTADNLDADFGYALLKASFGNFVWHDSNADGIQTPGELGIPNVTVNLINPDSGAVISTTQTNETGYYEFTELMPGNYLAEFVLPSGYKFAPQYQGENTDADSNPDVVTGRTEIIILIPGENNTTVDAGMVPLLASLGDYVWNDINQNGIQDSIEYGIANVLVNLVDPVTNTVILSTTTDETGYYLFTDLVPGNYIAEFVLPSGRLFTSPNQGDDSKDSDANVITGRTETVTILAGQNNLTADAGMYTPLLARIGDFVWNDINHNGIQDPGEPGVPGVTVKLFDDSGILLEQTVTNSTGYYNFSGLAPGIYEVGFVLPPEYEFTLLNQGNNDFLDSDSNSELGRTVVRVNTGTRVTHVDAGLYKLLSIYDPPGSYKTYSGNRPVIVWEMVWINDNPVPVLAHIEDAVSNPTRYIDGSLMADFGTYWYDENTYIITWEGEIPANSQVRIWYETEIPGYLNQTENQACAVWDMNGNGDWKDEASEGIAEVCSDDPDTTVSGDTTLWSDPECRLSIGNMIWNDTDNNGIYNHDNETGIDGVKLNLYWDTDSSGNYTPGVDDFVADTVSLTIDGEPGRYVFRNLCQGGYIVQADPANFNPDGVLNGYYSGPGSTDPDEDVNNNDDGYSIFKHGVLTNAVTLVSGQEPVNDGDSDPDTNLSVDLGFRQQSVCPECQCNLSMGDIVWNDTNNDGIFQTGTDTDTETGIDGVKINLYWDTDSSGDYTPGVDDFVNDTVSLTIDGEPGRYVFRNLCQGDYIIQADPANFNPGGVLDGYHSSPGNPDPDEDINNNDNGSPVTELGVFTSAVTLVQGQEPIDDGDSDFNTNLSVDFGFQYADCSEYQCNMEMGDIVWNDTNKDSVYQAGAETGINGVKFNLYRDTDSSGDYTPGSDDFITDTVSLTVDGEQGRYIFRNLCQDEYIVQADPANFNPGGALNGYYSSPGSPDPDEDNNNNDKGYSIFKHGVAARAVTLIPCQEPENDGDSDFNTNLSVDFGFRQQGVCPECLCNLSLGDIVWNDTNNDGIFQTGTDTDTETGIDGVKINLYWDTDNSGDYTPGADEFVTDTVSLTVDGQPGRYIFRNLCPGDYIVQIDPANFNAWGVLYEYYTSPGSPDPDEDINNNDNGIFNPVSEYGTVTSAVTLLSGQEPADDGDLDLNTNLSVDFGFYRSSEWQCNISMGDIVWYDTNNDGIRQVDPATGVEPGIDGIRISLWWDTDRSGDYTPWVDDFVTETVSITVDNEPGRYIFENLCQGDYIVQVEPENFNAWAILDGYSGSPGNPDPDEDINNNDNGFPISEYGVLTSAVTLVSGQEPSDDGDTDTDTNLSVDFGFSDCPECQCNLSMGDIIWHDANNDGIRQIDSDTGAEAGIDGVKVSLWWDTDKNGDYTPGVDELVDDTVSLTAYGESGMYIFNNLCQGDYIVQIDPVNFNVWGALHGYSGSPGNPDPDEDVNNNDNGYPVSKYGVLTNAVTLISDQEPVDDGDSDFNTNLSVDFGFYKPSACSECQCNLSLGDIVWHDANRDGIRQADTENGIDGIKINLYRDTDRSGNYTDADDFVDDTVSLTVGSESGRYIFNNLCQDDYIVQIDPANFNTGEVLDGYSGSPGNPDPDKDINNNDNGSPVSEYGIITFPVTLISGQEPTDDGDPDPDTNLSVDFGFYHYSDCPECQCNLSLGDFVWHDANNDGIRQADTEIGIDGIKINLYSDTDNSGDYTPGADEFVSETVSLAVDGEAGRYIFNNLCQGDYIVQIDPANFNVGGYSGSFNTGGLLYGYSGSPGNPDPDDDINNNDNGFPISEHGVVTSAVTLVSNQEPLDDGDYDSDTNLSVDFGFYQSYECECSFTLGNIVWRDIDNDGIYQAGADTGINGVKVNLYIDSDSSGNFTPGADEFAGTVFTDIADGEPGRYVFGNLCRGDYIVQIDPANFSEGGVLGGYSVITGSTDPDDDINNDNNGEFISGLGAVSRTVNLTCGGEPVNDGDADPSSNLTVDFGVFYIEPGDPGIPPMKPF